MRLNKIIKNASLRKEISSYIFVGLLGAGVDFAIFYLAIYLKSPILISQWLGALAGFTHNHIWQHYKVFQHNQKFNKTYIISLIISVISIIISGPFLLLLNNFIPFVWLNKIIILGLTFIILYLIRKKWIFIYTKT